MKIRLTILLLSLGLSSAGWATNHEHTGHSGDDHQGHDHHHTEKGHEDHEGHDDHQGEKGHGEHEAHEDHQGEKGHGEHEVHENHQGEKGHGEHEAHENHQGEKGHEDHEGHDDHQGEKGHEDHEGHDDHQGEKGHEGHGGHTDEHGDEVHLRPEQLTLLGIRTQPLWPRAIGEVMKAPGEVRFNAYASEQVAPRVRAQILQREVRLGDHVKAAQPLVILSSVEMAEAQGELLVAHREWQRVRSLGRKVVSESRYLQAQIAQQQGRARVRSYGMDDAAIDQLLSAGAKQADGRFVLTAGRNGTVMADDFIVGEIVEAGRALFQITDESVRWVEARLTPDDASQVKAGHRARVVSGDLSLFGKVAQIHHLLDETTRTRAVRIELPDPGHRLHPGQFVDVMIETGSGQPVMALPEAAVLRSADGDWQVFVAADEPGAFKPVEVRRVGSLGGLVVIDGLTPGAEVVMEGAFFLASEQAKGGFDPHNH